MTNVSISRLCACAYSIGSAQSVPPNGRSDTVFTASSSRCRGEIGSGVRPSVYPDQTWRPRFLKPPLPAKKPTTSYCDSVAAVTSASAAEASRGLRPDAGDGAAGHRAGHVEGEQQPLARGLD